MRRMWFQGAMLPATGMRWLGHQHSKLWLFYTVPFCHSLLPRNYILWNSCFILLSYWSLLTVLRQQWLWDVNVNECLSRSFRTCLRIDLQLTLFPCEPSKHDPSLSQAILPSPHWWVSELLKFQSPDALQQWPGLSFAHLWIVQGHSKGRGKKAGAFIRMYCFTFSIHHKGDDSILVKIHWTQIKSDGCYHWKLKSCHTIIGTNDEHWIVGLEAA